MKGLGANSNPGYKKTMLIFKKNCTKNTVPNISSEPIDMLIPNVQDPRIPSTQYKETYDIRNWQCVITEAGVKLQPSTAHVFDVINVK